MVPDIETFMKFAFHQTKLALDSLEVPVGCVIVGEGNNIVASGRNRTTESRNATRHAEMKGIDVLLDLWRETGFSKTQVAEKFSNCILYVTCKPCIMCVAALSMLSIKQVYYGRANDKFGGCGSILSLHFGDHSKRGFKCQEGIIVSEAVSLLRAFYEQGNPNAHRSHRPPSQLV
ncbi:unnamed protein product [Coffea canephora]|uniref:CMP/dCMP-type deaminase domain-containing protein n=1 Tax=Coffea canephora TaxID=49390 RepID=A0A068UH88_COFCA|nr:unnamed protein product [Coffea canephora]